MVNKSDSNVLLITQEIKNNELTRMIEPNTRFNFVAYYKNPLGLEDSQNNKDLCDCNILEITTCFNIDIENMMYLIEKESFRLFDVGFAHDGLHFLVINIGREEI